MLLAMLEGEDTSRATGGPEVASGITGRREEKDGEE